MKLIDIVNARYGLQQLVGQELPLPKAFELLRLTERCNLHLAFYGNERAKLGAEPEPEKLRELENMPAPDFENYEKIRIRISPEIRLSAAAVRSLLPLIEFEEE